MTRLSVHSFTRFKKDRKRLKQIRYTMMWTLSGLDLAGSSGPGSMFNLFGKQKYTTTEETLKQRN